MDDFSFEYYSEFLSIVVLKYIFLFIIKNIINTNTRQHNEFPSVKNK